MPLKLQTIDLGKSKQCLVTDDPLPFICQAAIDSQISSVSVSFAILIVKWVLIVRKIDSFVTRRSRFRLYQNRRFKINLITFLVSGG